MPRKKRNAVLDLAAYAAVRAVFGALKWTPEWIAYPLLDAAGRSLLWFARGRRRIALANLRIALGDGPDDRELLRVARRSCGSAFMVAADMAKVGRYVASGELARRVDVSAWAALRSRLDEIAPGTPPILCTPHLGSWEVGGIMTGAEFAGLHVIARPVGNPRLQRFIKRTRSQTGQHIHPRRGGIRYLVAGLRAGQAVGTLPDQNQRIRGVFVPVFGKLASCDRSQARLAQVTGSPIVVGAALRIGRRFRFRIAIADIFTVPGGRTGGGGKEEVLAGTARLHRAVEKLILEAPEQYFWVHNRYRTRPPQEGRDRGGKKRSA